MERDDIQSMAQNTTSDLTSVKDGQSAIAHALQDLSTRPGPGSEDSWTPEVSPNTSKPDLVQDVKLQSKEEISDLRSRSTTAIPSDGSDIEIPYKHSAMKREAAKRRKSVQVIFEESSKKGKYILTTADPEFQEILRSGLLQNETTRGRSRNRPRDLIFTKQFTTFDRQNESAAQSPFHGFFTLFWISMALLLIRIAAWNYRTKGSIFGDAEILHLMVDRDLFVMLTTDACMCAATSLGFFLHKAIAKNYLTWDGSGWIIQSLWEIFYTTIVIWVTFWREWPWTHTVFIVLHVFVLLMKQHAYSFYNGYRKFRLYSVGMFI